MTFIEIGQCQVTSEEVRRVRIVSVSIEGLIPCNTMKEILYFQQIFFFITSQI